MNFTVRIFDSKQSKFSVEGVCEELECFWHSLQRRVVQLPAEGTICIDWLTWLVIDQLIQIIYLTLRFKLQHFGPTWIVFLASYSNLNKISIAVDFNIYDFCVSK